jgi:hypothetical protein
MSFKFYLFINLQISLITHSCLKDGQQRNELEWAAFQQHEVHEITSTTLPSATPDGPSPRGPAEPDDPT